MPSRYVAVNAARTYLARWADVIINCTHTIAVCVLVSVQSGDRRQLKCVCVCVYL